MNPPIFKPATPADIPFIVYLLEEFYGKWESTYQIPFVPGDCAKSVETLIQDGICLVGPTSCAGATISPWFSNHSAKVAFTWFWYFQNAREIKIFEALVAACKQAGATHLSGTAHYPEFTILKHYAKLGLKPVELQSIVKL